jgi:hypothetical protein
MSEIWVHASRSPVIPGTRAHAINFIWFAVLFKLSLFTVFVAIAALALSITIAARGRTLTWCYRRLKSKLRGQFVSARPVFYRRRKLNLASYEHVPMSVLRGVPGEN